MSVGLLIGEALPDELALDRREAWTANRDVLDEVVALLSQPEDEDTDLPRLNPQDCAPWTRQYEPRLGELRRLFSPDE
ncbi:MAG: hypothetical protein IT305_26465 [Chloroflexi bacterium]|nr:hypothetical protein [Chloroflexota bacterium]